MDIGALAEVCLFYQGTSLFLGRGTLRQLLDTYGAESVLRFVEEGYVRPFYSAEMVGVMSHDVGTLNERHLPVAASIGRGDPEDEIVTQFRESTGRSGYGARRARAFLKSVEMINLGDPWQAELIRDFRNSELLEKAIRITARYAVGPNSDLDIHVERITELSDGYFWVGLDRAWASLQQQFFAQRGENLNKADLIIYFVEALTDLRLAAQVEADISTSPLGSDLLALKCADIAQVLGDQGAQIANFQDLTLRGRDIRSAINSGQRNLDDLMELLQSAQTFWKWLADKPTEAEIAQDYFKEVTARSWASRLPAKSLRLALLVGAGALIHGDIGLAAGGALSAADMFLVEKFSRVWRPNRFIEKSLDPFVSENKRK